MEQGSKAFQLQAANSHGFAASLTILCNCNLKVSQSTLLISEFLATLANSQCGFQFTLRPFNLVGFAWSQLAAIV